MKKEKKKVVENKESKLYEPMPMTTQLVLDNLAQSCEGYFPDKIYYFIQAIENLKNDFPDLHNELKKELPKIYPDAYNYYYKVVVDIKKYYDGLRGDKIVSYDVNDVRFVEFSKNMYQLPLINTIIYKIFYRAIKKTKLKDYSISSESWARARRKYKEFEPKEEQRYRKVSEFDEDDEGTEEDYE